MAQITEKLTSEKTSSKKVQEGAMNGILAIQHLIAMFGATVLVPILTGLDPSVALFSAGIGTLISLMIPYTVFFLIFWTALAMIWYFVGLPLGPASPIFL